MDNFGDFNSGPCEDDRTFSLWLEKDGRALNFDDISTAEDVNLGDIPFS